jgi:hypothetical protein
VIVSLDCETNGLRGQAFAAAAVAVDGAGREVDQWIGRCPVDGPTDPWVAEHVLPAIADVPVNCGSYQELLAAWRDWYGQYDCGATQVVGHVVWPVEARFLLDAHVEPFTGPYPLLDVASMLDVCGWDPLSVDDYLAANKLPLPEGSPHHPLYDARAAAAVYRHLLPCRCREKG